MEDTTMKERYRQIEGCCFDSNDKTFLSVDFTTDCPKRRAGKPCSYCYVEAARNIRCNAKKVYEYRPYQHEVMNLSKGMIARLNGNGGIRLFSFGDYMPEHDADIQAFLDDCLKVGLKVKVITKQPSFVHKYHDHKALNVIHVSVDNVGDGLPWDEAKALRSQYTKVRIRCAILHDEDIPALDFVDIFTLNHAKGLKRLGYTCYQRHRGSFDRIIKLYPGIESRLCCFTGSCATCSLKCAQYSATLQDKWHLYKPLERGKDHERKENEENLSPGLPLDGLHG
jgi:hypothetical protein